MVYHKFPGARKEESLAQTKQNVNFVATEHAPGAAEGGEGAAQGFAGCYPANLFASQRTQQNNIRFVALVRR